MKCTYCTGKENKKYYLPEFPVYSYDKILQERKEVLVCEECLNKFIDYWREIGLDKNIIEVYRRIMI